MFCALLTSRYQVSVYRTNGPLVIEIGREIFYSHSLGVSTADLSRADESYL